MHDSNTQAQITRDPFELVEVALANVEHDASSRRQAADALNDIARSAANASQPIAAEGATILAQLVEIVSLTEELGTGSQTEAEVVEFLRSAVPVLRRSLDASVADDCPLDPLISQARTTWGEWLDLIADESQADDAKWDAAGSDEDSHEEELAAPSAEELALILSSLAAESDDSAQPAPSDLPASAARASAATAGDPSPTEPFADRSPGELPPPPQLEQPESLEGELLDAYLDDAVRCLAGIESTVIAFEQNPHDKQPLQQMCRELHTLKGASASVGLSQLAGYLHHVEEFVQAQCDGGDGDVDASQLLASVDVVRHQIQTLQSPPAAEAAGTADNSAGTAAAAAPELAHDTDETVRVKASQLDRLMDMLAELVMLRNGRESRTMDLQRLNDELIRCATRLRAEDDAVSGRGSSGRASNPVREVAADVLEIARSQREVCEQITGENLAVSRFIRSFRQELTEVRRLPVSGLFHRLQRAVHDAARVEEKKVRLEMIGGHAGLERSLQEKLYEPLLHIVRNAVSHGIESEEVRVAAGKPAGGTVTLEARGASNLLILEIRDDGGGLDYDAIRRRGIERGILAADQPASRAELAQLIFHPGFSTRQGANAVAGRGVGMDVVAEAIERMRSWIEIESAPGQGTKIRLSIPLRSVIEHTMVFRCGGQLFAVPMQYVRGAGEADVQAPNAAAADTVSFNALFGLQAPENGCSQQRLVIGFGRKATSDESSPQFAQPRRQFAILVDEILGPEEVVVRPLPPLLRHQSLVSGVTLAGTGELVLMFDSQKLVERGSRPASQSHPASQRSSANTQPRRQRQRVLVVDDSISARRAVVRHLDRLGFETVEAGDGAEALQLLRDGGFAAVFSDLEMPRAGGLDLLRERASCAACRDVPVVIVSSRDEEKFKQQANKLGAFAYLTKPAAESRIAEELRRLGILPATRGEGEVH